jgi:hypothetical protein
MALPSFIAFYLQIINRKRSKDEKIYTFSHSELNILARKKTFKWRFDDEVEHLNFEDWGHFLPGCERFSLMLLKDFSSIQMKSDQNILIPIIGLGALDSKTFLVVLLIWQPCVGYFVCYSINNPRSKWKT